MQADYPPEVPTNNNSDMIQIAISSKDNNSEIPFSHNNSEKTHVAIWLLLVRGGAIRVAEGRGAQLAKSG